MPLQVAYIGANSHRIVCWMIIPRAFYFALCTTSVFCQSSESIMSYTIIDLSHCENMVEEGQGRRLEERYILSRSQSSLGRDRGA